MSLSRRNFLESAAAAAGSVVTASAASKKDRPNIILLLGDDHRWDALSCMGNRAINTPHLDQLSAQGITFHNHFCTTAICCVSRASIFLGQYAGTHHIEDFKTPLNPEQVGNMYSSVLRRAGYHTGFIGKFGVGGTRGPYLDYLDPSKQGYRTEYDATMPAFSFDYWEGFPGQGFYFPNGPQGEHLTYIMRDQAIEFIEDAPRDKPFCLSISFKSPHVQDEDPRQYLPPRDTLKLYKESKMPAFGAPQEDISRFPLPLQRSESRHRWAVRFSTPELYQKSIKGYYRLINSNDNALGSIRQALKRLGLADNTIIVYSADHGIFLAEHGLAGKWYMHEESIRMPLIIHDPRNSKLRGGQRTAMTLNIDLAPTILALAGLPIPVSYQGRNLHPLFDKDQPDWRALWYYEHHFVDRGWIPSSEGIRTRNWKYIRYTDVAAPYQELYNEKTDRHEVNNLVKNSEYAKQREVLSHYRDVWKHSLETWKAKTPWVDPIGKNNLTSDGIT
ncbi:MAG: sulfatase family protein [Ktedonobacteraceae bacterium]